MKTTREPIGKQLLNINSLFIFLRNGYCLVTIEFREEGALVAAELAVEIPGERRGVRQPRPRRMRLAADRKRACSAASKPHSATQELLRAYHQRGDLAARDRLIRQYLPLVISLARRYTGRGEDLDDLVQVGAIGLIKAIDRYEAGRGVELSSFAIPTIVGEIKRHLRDRAWPIRVPRRLQELNIQLRACEAELSAALERPVTVAEIAKRADVRPDEAAEALASARSQKPLSLSAPADNGNGAVDAFERSARVDEGYELGEDRALLAQGLKALDDRERRLIHLSFFRDLSQVQIAQEVGISQIHVSRVTRRALQRLRAEIGDTAPPRCA
jgi:RNA polymerase sigma-B factor